MDQRTDEWFEARRGKATSSRFADVMAKIKSGEAATRRNYRAQLVVERLTGTVAESYTNAAMQWGTDTEPLARAEYILKTGYNVEEVGFMAHPEIEAGASPDGLVEDDGLLEIKCPDTATHIQYLKNPESAVNKYLPQMLGQLWITGRKWCDFVSFDPRMPENSQLLVVRVERADESIAELEAEIKEFLKGVDEETELIKNIKL